MAWIRSRSDDNQATEEILVFSHCENLPLPEYIQGKSDWVDLRAAERVELKKGDFALISLGVSMKIPEGYEAHVVPRKLHLQALGDYSD